MALSQACAAHDHRMCAGGAADDGDGTCRRFGKGDKPPQWEPFRPLTVHAEAPGYLPW